MCGICGIISPQGVTEAVVQSMTETLNHRGPDEKGVFADSTVGLGHRRLSIIDLKSGQQPMANTQKTVWITYNGEIYNYKELRKNLLEKYDFKTQSDTEVVLHMYEEYGEACVNHLRGMFAFAIYDKKAEKLMIARDHLGQKPLYYHHEEDLFLFASEIKSILKAKPELKKINPNALYEYFTIRIITPPRSMFSGISKLPPGHILVFQNGNVTVKRYWDLRYCPKIKGDFPEVLKELEKQVAETINLHMVSDVPLGAFLSGGLDSGLIVGMMSQFAQTPVETFSGDVPYETFSEGPYARMVSDRYGTNHHDLTINVSLVKSLPELVWHLDEPSDPLAVCMYALAELTRKYVKVVLGGDGGDELFGGYDRYYGNIYAGYYAMMPDALRKYVFGKMIDAIPEGFWYQSLSHKLRWIHQISFKSGGRRYADSLSYFYFSDPYKDLLYTDQFKSQVALFDPEASIKHYYDCDNAEELVDKMLYADSMTRMPDHPNMILDRMTMAHGLEARAPFLDHKLAEFCASIPVEYKVKGRKRRIIQYALAKKYLPKEVIERKKQGFSSPLPYILADEFKLIYKTFLKNAHLVKEGYIKQALIDKLLSEHLSKKMDHGQRLWLLCNAEVWYRMHIEDEQIRISEPAKKNN